MSLLRPNALLAISTPLLILLTRSPPSIHTRILSLLPAKLNQSRVITTLIYLFVAGLGAQLNSLLNAWARNNWVFKNWGRGRGEAIGTTGWDNEVAVITGGSNGIGALVSKGLASRGVKVAVLDITEPKEQSKTLNYPQSNLTNSRKYTLLRLRHHLPYCRTRRRLSHQILLWAAEHSH
jgi:hypothetical protein